MNEEFDLLNEQSGQTDNVGNQSDAIANQEIEVYVMNDVYSGTISDTYLDYFSGIVEKLDYDEHYVVWRSADYEYCMAFGEDLVCNGYSFTGSDLWIARIWRESNNYNSTWNVSYSVDDININGTDKFLYSDLGDVFPTVRRGASHEETYTLLFLVSVFFIYSVLRDIFKSVSK